MSKQKSIQKKEHKTIQWKGSNLNKEAGIRPAAAVEMEVFHSLICVLLFMLSARIMLVDVFSWISVSTGNILVICIFAILISGIMEASYYINGKTIGSITLDQKMGYFLRWGVLVAGVLFCVIYWILKGEELLSGSCQILYLYLKDWNLYYGSSLYVDAGNYNYLSGAIDFWMVVICCFLLWEAKMLRKNMILVLAPLSALVSELLVGHTPKELGIFLMLAGILLANILGWKDISFRPMAGKSRGNRNKGIGILAGILGAFILILCTMVKVVGTSSAEQLVEDPEVLVQFQKNLEEWFVNFSFGDFLEGNTESKVAELDNETPQFDNTPVLSLKTVVRPEGTLYLKGFSAGNYSNGIWKTNGKSFEKACKKAGYDSDLVSQELASLGVLKLYEYENLDYEDLNYSSDYYWSHYWSDEGLQMDVLDATYNSISTIDVTLNYLDSSGTKAFAPYFFELGDEDFQIEGDCCLTKKKSLTELSFSIWRYGASYVERIGQFSQGTKREWEDWYEDYVMEHYLDVPEEMTNIKWTVEHMNKLSYTDYAFASVIDQENAERLAKAYSVQQWLEEKTEYSLELSDVPEGMDPIEYFVGRNREGYCMHYASAGVMLLRELGVPARYVSGYVVNSSSFERSEDGFEATVLDNQAHAWVEIYLNGIGWVPFEMTKGYYGDIVLDNMEEESEAPETPEESQTEENSQDSQEEESETQASESLENTQSEEEKDSKNDEGAGGLPALLGKILCVVILCGVAMAVFLFFKKQELEKKKLRKEIRRKQTRRAIKRINRKLYKRLRFAGKTFNNHLRDEEYEAILKKTYNKIPEEDWKRYMVIVKAAAFSTGDPTQEDMQFCCEIYRKITQNY